MSYNGWTNYDTWNVALWVQNEEPIYREARAITPDDCDADMAEDIVRRRLFPDGTTPDKADFSKVDWDEIAECLREL